MVSGLRESVEPWIQECSLLFPARAAFSVYPADPSRCGFAGPVLVIPAFFPQIDLGLSLFVDRETLKTRHRSSM